MPPGAVLLLLPLLVFVLLWLLLFLLLLLTPLIIPVGVGGRQPVVGAAAAGVAGGCREMASSAAEEIAMVMKEEPSLAPCALPGNRYAWIALAALLQSIEKRDWEGAEVLAAD